jgi:Fic family protein
MQSFDHAYLERLRITHSLLRTVRLLGEYRGRAGLYRTQHPQALETLRQVAIVQSTESSNRIEGVTAPFDRIQALVAEKTAPRDRSEQEIAGYRDVLNTIHANHSDMPFTPGVVLQLHRDLFRYTGGGGQWKSTSNQIVAVQPDGTRHVRFQPVAPFQTPSFMERLHELCGMAWREERIDRLLLIPAYVLDFLCIHPFLDGNGRIARLLTLLLLYQAGYDVGRFISLEQVIERTKESYYDSLQRSSQGWHQREHDLVPWAEYLLGTLVGAYQEFEERVGMLTTARGAKTQMVLDAVQSAWGEFTVGDLQRQCPTASVDLIRKVLRREKEAGRVDCSGPGRDARWWRI